MELEERIKAVFKEKFRSTPVIFIAPGRINLIGEHVDYNEGFVLPSAVDRYMVFAVAPGTGDRCNIYAADFQEGVSFSVNDLNPGQTWVNFLMGVIDGFQRRGLLPKGVDCVFGGNIPAGGGLSSSAALCCGFAFALNKTFRLGLSRLELAKISQASEHNFIGANVGLMDQYASLFSHHESVLLLDCRTEHHDVIPVKFESYEILLIDTNVKHSHGTSAYNDRRAACEEGVNVIQRKHKEVRALRDVTLPMLQEFKEKLKADVFEKCEFIVEEIARTLRAADLLKKNELTTFGELMYQSHWGLSKKYQISCDESDKLVTWATDHKEKVIGARQMGGGFGGCTINLITPGFSHAFQKEIRRKYYDAFKKEPDFYSVTLADGVHQRSAH